MTEPSATSGSQGIAVGTPVRAEPALEHRNTYIRPTLGTLRRPSGDVEADARQLVQGCLRSLENQGRFPPRLFVLWMTPCFQERYGRYQTVLDAVTPLLPVVDKARVPLIGCSVAACLFEEDVHAEGALLLCLASRFLKARVAVAKRARVKPKEAVQEALKELHLVDDRTRNQRRDSILVTFLPGYDQPGRLAGFQAAEIFRELDEQTNRQLHMFGGVACGSGRETSWQEGWQFVNGQAYQGSAALALITSQLAYGQSFDQGLKPTDKVYYAGTVVNNGRTITTFQPEGAAADILKKNDKPWVLQVDNVAKDSFVVLPEVVGDAVEVQLPVKEGDRLTLMAPEEEQMQQRLTEIKNWLAKTYKIDPQRFAALLALPCAARYNTPAGIEYLRRYMASLKASHPLHVFVGSLMDGEVGTDSRRLSQLRQWSISELDLIDDLFPRGFFFLGIDALQQYTRKATTAGSLLAAMKHIVACVEAAGYPGGMVSLVLDNDTQQWIVAQEATPGVWEDTIKPRTRRKLEGGDLLARVARGERDRFVRNATNDEDSDLPLAREAKVISLYVIPLTNEDGRTIAILQIDLGDLRDKTELAPEQREILNAIGDMAAVAVNRAIQTEELKFSRELDKLQMKCLESNTLEEAAEAFVNGAADALNVDGFLRLLERRAGRPDEILFIGRTGNHKLRTRDVSSGEQGSAEERRRVAVDRLPANSIEVINDAAEHDTRVAELLLTVPEDSFRTAVRTLKAYAAFPICSAGDEVIGELCVYSKDAWFFTQSHLRSLHDIGQRLYQLQSNITLKQAEEQRQRELKLLHDIRPEFDDRLNLHEALKNQMKLMRKAAFAEVVSCYLWDEMQQSFVLRAMAGWKDEDWVDAAFYEVGQGMTGTLASCNADGCSSPRHIDDLAEYKRRYFRGSQSAWHQQMFGAQYGPNPNYEVIALPLHFKSKSLGIVTMHRRKEKEQRGSRFVTTNQEILEDAATNLSAFVAALQQHDLMAWESEEQKRLTDVMRTILDHQAGSASDLNHVICKAIVDFYAARSAAIYQTSPDGRSLDRIASHCRAGCSVELPDQVRDAGDLVWEAFTLKEIREKRHEVDCTRLHSPKELRKRNVIERVCVPLEVSDRLLGVLDIRWKGTVSSSQSSILPHHGMEQLETLGRRIATTLHVHMLRRKSEETKLAAEQAEQRLAAIRNYLLVNLHFFIHRTQSIDANFSLFEESVQPAGREHYDAARQELDSLIDRLRIARSLDGVSSKSVQSRFALFPVLTEIVARARESQPRAMIDLECPETLRNREMLANREQIRSCFQELVDNALKFIPKTGGRIGVMMNVETARSDATKLDLVVRVRDNGPGMSEPVVVAVATKCQVDKQVGIQNGFGLYMAQLFADLQGGSLRIESTGSEGTTIAVRLRLEEGHA